MLLGQTKVGADSKDEKKRGTKRRRKVKKELMTAESDGIETLIDGEDTIGALFVVEEANMEVKEYNAECLEPKKERLETKTDDITETQSDVIETTMEAIDENGASVNDDWDRK